MYFTMWLVVLNFISRFQNYSIVRSDVLLVHYKLFIIEYFEVLKKLWL